jgi:hypothetical protein
MPSHIWDEPSREVADLPRNSPEYRADLNRRLGLAYLSGIEKWSRVMEGRGLTANELGEAVRNYPGDVPIAS